MKYHNEIVSLWNELKDKVGTIYHFESRTDHFFMEKFVESLRYYGDMDEGVELFESTCSLAYQMYGLGRPEEALLLVIWAAQQAKESEQYKYEFQTPIHGRWGY